MGVSARQLHAPRVGGFCDGGGGSILGEKLLGWVREFYCEREGFCQRIIKARIADGTFDDAPLWDNVRTFDGLPWRDVIDIMVAGFPCQPFSVAGRRKAGADSRNLWPDIWRLLGEIRPPLALFENVPGLKSATYARCACGYPDSPQVIASRSVGRRIGGCPCCGRPVDATADESVRYFGTILRELDALGYGVLWDCVPACAARAPHRRDRLWLLCWDTHADRDRLEGLAQYHRQWWERLDGQLGHHADGLCDAVADSNEVRRRQNERHVYERQSDAGGCGSQELASPEQSGRHGRARQPGQTGWAESADGSASQLHDSDRGGCRSRAFGGVGAEMGRWGDATDLPPAAQDAGQNGRHQGAGDLGDTDRTGRKERNLPPRRRRSATASPAR